MFSAERLHPFDAIEAKGALLISQLAVGDEKVTIAQQRFNDALGFEAVFVAVADPEGQRLFNSDCQGSVGGKVVMEIIGSGQLAPLGIDPCLLYTSDAADE